MITRIKKHTLKILTITIVILSIVSIYMIYNMLTIERAKVKLLNNQVVTLSDIEILERWANKNATSAKTRLYNIDELKQTIWSLEKMYEKETLTKRCYESQIDRKINWLEYNVKYCELPENLEQFRSKK